MLAGRVYARPSPPTTQKFFFEIFCAMVFMDSGVEGHAGWISWPEGMTKALVSGLGSIPSNLCQQVSSPAYPSKNKY